VQSEEKRLMAYHLREALAGPKGSLDEYLELNSEDEVRRDIISLTGMPYTERRIYAAMAMQGILAGLPGGVGSAYNSYAKGAVDAADALIAELGR
jgi:hypothetical protein